MDNYSGLRTNLTMLMDFYEITSFDEREVIIPPISREIEAKVLPSLTTIMPPFIFSTYFKTIFIKIR